MDTASACSPSASEAFKLNHLTLGHLTDDDLLANTRRLIGHSNQIFAALLAHLAEVETRGVHRRRACASLYTYCIYELRMSEDAAFRRVAAAKFIQRFPALLAAVERGELHLTGLLLLGPHLTEANQLEVLARAKHRTKKEILSLVRILSPLPNVPSRIEPLGLAPAAPATRGVPLAASWNDFVASLCPASRALPHEQRPAAWLDAAQGGNPIDVAGHEPRERTLPDGCEFLDPAPARCETTQASEPLATHLEAEPNLSGPQRYKVQFTATEEYIQLYEEAKGLLSHARSARTIEAIHLRAMQALVAELKKRKYAVTTQPGKDSGPLRGADNASEQRRERAAKASVATEVSIIAAATEVTKMTGATDVEREGAEFTKVMAAIEATEATSEVPGVSDSPLDDEEARELGTTGDAPRQRGRYIPAAVRRAVFERDGGRCVYADESGQRCRETRLIEVHHVEPFARGGDPWLFNLALLCAAHNALAGEDDFGRDFIVYKRDSLSHASFAQESSEQSTG